MANPTPYSDEIFEAARGDIVLRCVKSGGHVMTAYGQYAWAEDEERSLFDETLPDELCVSDFGYPTAKNMITDAGCELAQCLASGDFVVVLDRKPNPTRLYEAVTNG